MSEIDPITLANIRLWYSELDDPDYGRMAHYNLGTRWREVIGFLLTEARRQAFEEAAKVADAWGASKYSADCTTMADTIATDIRALASDALLDRQESRP